SRPGSCSSASATHPSATGSAPARPERRPPPSGPFLTQAPPPPPPRLGALAPELGGAVVDIGANVGDSAAAVRSESEVPILAVEGDPRFYGWLVRNAARIGDVELEQSVVEEPEEGTFERGLGTARLVPGGDRLRSKPLAQILEEHPRFA